MGPVSQSLKEQLSRQLHSTIYFYNFLEQSEVNCEDGCAKEIKNYLSISNRGSSYIPQNDIDKIKKAVCYVDKMYKWKDSLFSSNRCHFLYFWIGHELSRSLIRKEHFGSVLQFICTLIQGANWDSTCKLYCTNNIDDGTHKHMKTIFDFLHDYNTIYTLTREHRNTCNEKYKNYLEEIKSAYGAVDAYCTKKQGDDYCRQYWTDSRKSKIQQNLLNLECAPKPTKEEKTTCPQEAEEPRNCASTIHPTNNHPSTTTTALSSIFVTLATIGAPFLLYKYKPWSSWFRNHTSGNGRSGRSNRRRRSTRNEFDTLAEGASTVDFTGSSEGSSILDSPTVHSSAAAAYTRQLNRGREGKAGANNSTLGHRNNVGYGRM